MRLPAIEVKTKKKLLPHRPLPVSNTHAPYIEGLQLTHMAEHVGKAPGVQVEFVTLKV